MPSSAHANIKAATGPDAALDFGVGNAFGSWTMTVTQAAPDSQVALETSPDSTTWTRVGVVTGMKSCSLINAGIGARYARMNVVSLGTNPPGAAVSAIVTPS